MTPQEALDAIGRLCDGADRNLPGFAQALWPEDIRAILDPANRQPVSLLAEWAGPCPYGTLEQVHDLNIRVATARHRAATRDGINLKQGAHA